MTTRNLLTIPGLSSQNKLNIAIKQSHTRMEKSISQQVKKTAMMNLARAGFQAKK